MNTNTGVIIENDVYQQLGEDLKKDYAEIANKDMTMKQSITRKVSLHDHKSKLGKQLTHIRSSRNLQRSQRRG